MSKREKGLFITFEGGEGSGKTTAIRKIADWLQEQGMDVLVTREPGGVYVAEKIRELLVSNQMDALTEAMLFTASRNEVTKNVILPALEEGKIVLCDRFVDSSYVYQGIVRGLGLEMVEQINKPITDQILPDITIYFDIKPEVGLARIQQNNRETNKFDEEGLKFHYQVREGYQTLAKMPKHQNRIQMIDAEQTPENVVQDCIQILKQSIKEIQ